MPTKHKGSDSSKKTRMDIGGSLQGTRWESFGKGPSLFLKEIKFPLEGNSLNRMISGVSLPP